MPQSSMMLPSFFLIRRPVQTAKPEMRTRIATAMRVEDVYVQNRRLWVNLREKGGKAIALPCHHTLEAYLHAYLDGTGLASDPQGRLFRTLGRGTGRLTRTPLPQANAYAMIQRRARAAGIRTRIGAITPSGP